MKKSSLCLIFFLLIGLPFSYGLQLTENPTFSYDSAKGTAISKFTIKNTVPNEKGIIELQMTRSNPLYSVILGNPTACQTNTVLASSNKHISYQFGSSIEFASFTITNTNIPDGTYYPSLVHVNQCCNTGSCSALQPFGWGYELNGGKVVTFKASSSGGTTTYCPTDTKQCPDGSFVGREGANCEFKACPTTSGGTTSGGDSSNIDFKISNLIRIDDLEANELDELNVPFFARLDRFGGATDIYRFTIKNTGSKSSPILLETFYVAQSNPFSKVVSQGLQLTPLQATFGFSGIKETDLTCKGDSGSRLAITEMQPNEERSYFFSLDIPRKGNVIAGNNNYDINGHYYLIINAINSCSGTTEFYDMIGGTKNFKVDLNSNIVDDDGGNIPEASKNNTAINEEARQKGVDLTEIKGKTTKDLTQSLCTGDNMCEDDTKCRPLSYLITKGQLTSDDAESKIEGHVEDITTAAGIVTGALTAPLICKFAGKTLGKATIATSVITIPVCQALTSVTGAYIGYKVAKIGGETEELFDALNKKDKNGVGYCINQPEENNDFSIKGMLTSIGSSINDVFDTTGKISSLTLGVLVVLGIILLFAIKKS